MLLSILSVFASVSHAEPDPQLFAMLKGDKFIGHQEVVSLRAKGSIFWMPEFDVLDLYAHLGPSLALGERLELTFQTGLILGGDTSLGALLSTTQEVNVVSRLNLFLVSEVHFKEDGPLFFGYYQAYWAAPNFDIGFHWEQYGSYPTLGPDLGLVFGPLYWALEWHQSPQDGSSAVRLVMSVTLGPAPE